jgi:hypothetical protein
VRRYLARSWDGYVRADVERVAQLEATIGRIREAYQEGGFEDARARLEDRVRELAKHRGRLETIGYDPARWPANAAAVVDAAGGVDHIVACVQSAWQVSGKWLEADGSFPMLEAHRETLKGVEAKRAKVSDARSRLAVALRAERDAAAARVEATERAIEQRREAHAVSLVGRAAGADEGGIEELTALAVSCPHAFPEDFATAFEALKPSDEQLIGTLEVLLTGE